MPHITLTLIILLATFISLGIVCTADTNTGFYSGYSFDQEIIPSGMVPYDDTGWSHGSLFSAPYWLLRQIDQNLMSTVLDRGLNPTPISIPENYRSGPYVFKEPSELKPYSTFPSISPSEQGTLNQSLSSRYQQPIARYSPFSRV